MKTRWIAVFACIAVALLGVARPANAQWVVVDPTALTQLLIQVQQISQEITLAESTLAQAQQSYAAITGNRGMQALLSGTNRNYLPANWGELSGAMGGGGGAYAGLGSDVTATVNQNAILTPTQVSQLSANELESLTERRQALALLESLARTALANNSNRFGALQTLINAIPAATDEKGIMDLNARISAEQTMVSNDQEKLGTLYQAAQVLAESERERADEKAIADIGHLNALPPMGLGRP